MPATFFLKQKFTTSRREIFLLIFMFNIALPFLGYLLTFWLVYYLLNVKYTQELTHVNAINMDEFENEFPEVQRIFGEGSMKYLMNDENADNSLRMKALVSLADNASREELKLIKNSLSDKNDEIRLYSFAVIDHKERVINEKIHQQMEKLLHADSPNIKAMAAEELVYLYWDMIYFELSDSDLKHFIVQEIEKYAQIVLDREPKHTKVNVVLGKMYLMEEDFNKAEKYFDVVVEQEGEKDFILPYLAEIYYSQRNFSATKKLLKRAEKIYLNTMLNPVVQQWSIR